MADAYNQVIKLSMDYSSFEGSTTEINRKMKMLDAEFKLARESVKGYADETTDLSINIQQVSEKIALQNKKVEQSKQAYDNALQSGEASDRQLDRLKQNYLNNQIQLAKFNNELNECRDKLEKAENAMKDTATASGKIDDSMKKAKDSAIDYAGKLYIIEEALQVVKEATMAYVDFDTAISKVNTIADTNVVSLKNLKSGVYAIAKDTKQGASDIANALYQSISANVDTKDALNVTRQAAELAKAGFTDTATSVDVLTTIMNSYGLSADQVSIVSDKLIQVQNLGKTTVGEFGDSFGKVAGLANEAGISLDEVLAATSTLTKVNGSASESLTALKAGISNIVKPTAEAKEIASQLGIKFNATALQSKGLSGFLEMVQKASHGNIETMAKLFGSTEALNAMLVLTGSGAESFASDLNKIKNSGGTTDTALSKLDGTGNNFKGSMENLKTTLIQLGDVLSPIIDLLSFVFNVLSNIPSSVYVVIGVLVALILVLKNIAAIKSAWAVINGLLSTSLGVVTGTTEMTAASMMKLFIVIVAIVAVIALVVAGVKSVRSAMHDANGAASDLGSSLSNVKSAQFSTKSAYTGTQYHAFGTDDFPGGKTIVGEEGPEEVTFPKGTTIKPANKTGRGEITIVNINVDAKNVDDYNRLVDLAKQKRLAIRRGVI